MLVAKRYVGKDKYNNAIWECVCDCGKTTTARAGSLKRGDKKSCGCLHKPDLTGRRFGRLVVLRELRVNNRRQVVWECKCDCGNIVEIPSPHLLSHHKTKSCGCLMREKASTLMKTHGKTGERLYVVWSGMKARCENPNHHYYKNYGGRGIKVCDEWHDYEVFEKWALENGYDKYAKQGICTIDRIDNDGNYEPSNCRWVDAKIQASNRRPKQILKEEKS